jgi:hypothetical protein
MRFDIHLSTLLLLILYAAPRAAQRILCCWFSGACETMGQVPQCTGKLY